MKYGHTINAAPAPKNIYCPALLPYMKKAVPKSPNNSDSVRLAGSMPITALSVNFTVVFARQPLIFPLETTDPAPPDAAGNSASGQPTIGTAACAPAACSPSSPAACSLEIANTAHPNPTPKTRPSSASDLPAPSPDFHMPLPKLA